VTNIPVVTIDGPSGVGKGTLASMLADDLGWHVLDSGALYRVLGLAAQHHKVPLDSVEALTPLAAHLDVTFDYHANGDNHIILEGENVTNDIRTESAGSAASLVASIPAVRDALLERQRAFLSEPGLVADGRDMGTVVFPDAPLKIFLNASAKARAERRFRQLNEMGKDVSMERLLEEINARDERDRNRPVAPLVAAQDALTLDTTGLTIEQVFSWAQAKAREAFA